MRNIAYLQNTVKNKYWGDTEILGRLFGVPNPQKEPQAELWLGAHPLGVSKIQKGRKLLTLEQITARNPEGILGPDNVEAFNSELPFLLKIVTVQKPTPAMVHPNHEQAAISYARENLLQVASGDPHRNYVDENGRPKILYALEPFEILCGFKKLDKIKEMLAILTPRFFAEHDLGRAGLKTLFMELMELNGPLKNTVLAKALQNADKLPDKDAACVIKSLAKEFPGDMGLFMPVFLNTINLKAGEAVYIEPRTLHCYLKGAGLELGGNSANVLRCALTQKHVDLTEVGIIAAFEPKPAPYLAPQTFSAQETLFAPPGCVFMLSVVSMPIKGQLFQQKKPGPEILLCGKGKFTIGKPGQKTGLAFSQGQSMFVSYEVGGYILRGQGVVYRALLA